MRILFSSTPLAGHFGPMLPFVRSLLSNGHDVMVAASSELEASVAASGAAHGLVSDPSPDVIGSAFRAMQGMSHDQATLWMAGEIFGRIRTTAAIPGLLQAAERWRPEVIVRETAEFAGAVVADKIGVPHARVGIGLGATEELILSAATAAVADIRQAHGLPPDPGGSRLHSAPFLTLFPAGLEDPRTPSPARTQRFRDPAWQTAPAPPLDTNPLVYVTFGSVAGQMAGVASVFGEALQAVDGLGADVVMTVGNTIDINDFGPLPAGVRVERWIDQGSVLRHASAVLCHGGGGSVMGALAAGVPIVAVPLFAEDQHINAHRLRAIGAGEVAAPRHQAMRAALTTVLASNTHRAAARAMSSEISRHTSTDDLTTSSLQGPAGIA